MNATATLLFVLAPLPYDIAALEPYISEQTLHYHHDKHLAGYVNKLNELIVGTPFEGMTLEQIIGQADGPIFNNAAQVWNHESYFNQFSPTPTKEPKGELKRAIEDSFGGVEALKEKLSKESLNLFGSGWVWLAADDNGKLHIISTSNAGTPLTEGLHPLLAIDVWEHAYYIDHRNARADGIKSFWKVLDWDIVSNRYNK
jgi:Fe-Mn family superoxide dismutase